MEKISIVALRRERKTDLDTAALLRARRREATFSAPTTAHFEQTPPPAKVLSEPIYGSATNEFTFDVVLQPELSEAICAGHHQKNDTHHDSRLQENSNSPEERTVILRFYVTPQDSGRILTTEEACEFLKISRRTIYRFVKNGKLPARRLGSEWRFREKDLLGALSTTQP